MSAGKRKGYYRGIEIFQDDLKTEHMSNSYMLFLKKFCESNKIKNIHFDQRRKEQMSRILEEIIKESEYKLAQFQDSAIDAIEQNIRKKYRKCFIALVYECRCYYTGRL